MPLAAFLVHRLEPLVVGRSDDEFVFSARGGGPVRHNNFYARTFKPGVRRAALDDSVRFHDLRHTCAAWLVDSGAHVRAVMESLGHSSPSVTLGTYGHLFPSLTEKPVDGMQERWERGEREPSASRLQINRGCIPRPPGLIAPAELTPPGQHRLWEIMVASSSACCLEKAVSQRPYLARLRRVFSENSPVVRAAGDVHSGQNGAAGNRKTKVEPEPSSETTVTSPPWLSATWRTIDNPSPEPPVTRLRARSTR